MNLIVAIVTYNNELTLETCLKSVASQNVPLKLLIIDNGSSDNTRAIVGKHQNLTVIKNKKNTGYAGGNNQAIVWAKKRQADYLLILNPDTILLAHALKQLVSAAKLQNNQGIFGSVIYRDRQKKQIWSKGGILDAKRYSAKLISYPQTRLDFISGTCLLIPRRLINTELKFHEPYFMYYEDLEFCMQAKKLGFPPTVVTESKIIHSEVSRAQGFMKIKNYYLARNHLLFVERNAPYSVKLHELVRLPKTIWEHTKNRNRGALVGIKDYTLRNFGQYG